MDEIGWLSIIEYSVATGMSVSTIRRRIKSKTIEYKEIEGKYLIRSNSGVEVKKESALDESYLTLSLENERLKIQIKKLQSEIIEQKMLIDLLEKTTEIPPIPGMHE